MIREQFGDDVAGLPDRFKRFYHFQLGLINLFKGDIGSARDDLELAIDPDSEDQYDGNQLFMLTLASFLNSRLGDMDKAEQRLTEAERIVRRARLNGIDDSSIYYTESSIHVMKGEYEQAIVALQEAYNRGWRQSWVLDIDARLDPIRDLPEFLAIKTQVEEDISKARAEVLATTLAQR